MNKQDYQKAKKIDQKIADFESVKKRIDNQLAILVNVVSPADKNPIELKRFINYLSGEIRPVVASYFNKETKELKEQFGAIGEPVMETAKDVIDPKRNPNVLGSAENTEKEQPRSSSGKFEKKKENNESDKT